MANARQVGTPHSLQFVFGRSLNICMPVNAISVSFVGVSMSVVAAPRCGAGAPPARLSPGIIR